MSATKQNNSPSQGISLRDRKSEPARCAFSENGEIVFASDSFYDLVGIPNDSAKNGASIFDVFVFEDERGEIFPDPKTLQSDIHALRLKTDRSMIRFQLDWLETSDHKRFLIASQTDKSSRKIGPEDTGAILTKINKALAGKQGQPEDTPRVIREQSELLLFMGMSQDIMLVLDRSGGILRANNIFFDRIGYRPAEMEGLNFLDFFPPGDKPNTLTHFVGIKRAIEKNQSVSADFEGRMIARDGQSLWTEWTLKNFRGMIYALGRDITATKNRQSELAQREKQLSEAESIGHMGHWRWQVDSEDIAWSEEVFRIFGLDPNHFQPTLKRINDTVHRSDIARMIQAFQRAIIEKKSYDMEFRIARPSGEIRYIYCEGRCEKDAEGEVVALYGIMQDLTERIVHERELRAAKDASEQAYAAKTRFLANMSHELRTPLNAIIGFSEMIEHQLLGPVENKKYSEYATGIRESGEHLLDLISDILDMSKIEAGKYSLDLSSLRMGEIIKAAVKMVKGRAEEGKIRLEIDEEIAKDIKLVADARALKQIILNILTNAVKFTKEGGSVWMECQPREEHLTLKICDTGIGIPANQLAAVLRPFEQVSTHYTKDYEGTGLGLSITKELVELHGGSIHIESTVGIGTAVTIRLPYDASKFTAASRMNKQKIF